MGTSSPTALPLGEDLEYSVEWIVMYFSRYSLKKLRHTVHTELHDTLLHIYSLDIMQCLQARLLSPSHANIHVHYPSQIHQMSWSQ